MQQEKDAGQQPPDITLGELTGGEYIDAQAAATMLGFKDGELQVFRSRMTERIAGVRKQNGREYRPGALARALPEPVGVLRGAGRGALVFRAEDVLASRHAVSAARGASGR